MICTYCGHEVCNINIIDDATRLCNGCIDTFFTFCDECNKLCDIFTVKFFTLKDGRQICENCRENFNDEDIDID